MVAALPPNIQLKLEQTLSQWQHWRCETALPYRPRLISRFDSGLSNYSILVEAQQQFVVRIDGTQSAVNGLSRTAEWSVLLAAHRAGLAPCPRYFNPDLGSLVCDFLPQDTSPRDNISTTAALLRSIHQLPTVHHRLDLHARIVHYQRQVRQRNSDQPQIISAAHEGILRLADTLAQKNEATVLCHNDLLAANRIYSGGTLKAIDWEYCAMGSAWFDLAVVAIGDGLDDAQKSELLNAYLSQPADRGQIASFELNCIAYQYLELLWYLANRPDAECVSKKLTKLQTVLSGSDYL